MIIAAGRGLVFLENGIVPDVVVEILTLFRMVMRSSICAAIRMLNASVSVGEGLCKHRDCGAGRWITVQNH